MVGLLWPGPGNGDTRPEVNGCMGGDFMYKLLPSIFQFLLIDMLNWSKLMYSKGKLLNILHNIIKFLGHFQATASTPTSQVSNYLACP